MGTSKTARIVGLAAAISLSAIGGYAPRADANDVGAVVEEPARLIGTVDAASGATAVAHHEDPDGTRADVGDGSAEVSSNPDEGLVLHSPSGATVSLGVPGTAAQGTVIDGNVVYPEVAEDAAVVARPVLDGVQALVVIDGDDAPSRYEFPVDAGPETHLRPHADGSIEVLSTEDGASIAKIDAPWATDAAGKPVPTRYEIAGSSVIQVVDHVGAAYPVTADPKVTLGWSIYVRYSKKEVKTFKARAPYIAVGTMVAGVCKSLPVPGPAKVICAAATAVAFAAILDTFTKAAKENKCVEIKYAYSGDLDGWKRYKC